MYNKYLISVIIPVYNAQKYIEKCARSLFQQTVPAPLIEFIFINDCSTDSGISILENLLLAYPNRYQHVRIIHHNVNRGIAAVRNTGLDEASGKYIGWTDSDDWLEPDMFETLLEAAEKGNFDTVSSNYYLEKSGVCTVIKQPWVDKPTYLNRVLLGEIDPVLWNRLIRRSFLEAYKFRFIAGCNIAEDKNFIFKIITKASRIGYIDKPLYHYYRNMTSLTNSGNSRLIHQEIENAKDLLAFIEENQLTGREVSREAITFFKLYSKKNLLFSFKKEDYKAWRHLFSEANRYVLRWPVFNLRYKCIALLCALGGWPLIDIWLLLKRRYYKQLQLTDHVNIVVK